MIEYSRGVSVHDNHPRACHAADFAEFIAAISSKRAASKETAGYFCGPLNGDGLRCAEGAMPRSWLAVDIDRIDADLHDDVRLWIARFLGCGWPTHSSTAAAPRLRALLALDRDATRQECMEVGRAMMHDMEVQFGAAVLVDPSTFRGEQPIFNPPEGAAVAQYSGAPMAVDIYLGEAAALPPDPAAPALGAGGKVTQDRNDYLSRLAFKLAKTGLGGNALAAALLSINADECSPPLAEDEVRGIAARKKGVRPDPEPALGAVQQAIAEQQPANLFLLTIDDLDAAAQRVTWAVKHILPADSVGVMFGAPGTFKSFIALDMALHIAHGIPWLGKKTKRGSVVYLAAEGGTGLMKRIRAWHAMHGMAWDGIDFRVITVPVMLSSDAQAVAEAATAAGIAPSLIVVDTKSQTDEGEENSSTDTAKYFRQLGACFRALWNCTVLVIHHSGHSATERPRGSSALMANVDFMFAVFRDEKEMLATMECSRQKDVELFAPVNFSMVNHTLGEDEDGESITSLVATHINGAAQLLESISGEGRAGRGGHNRLLMGLAVSGMPEKELRHLFQSELDGKEPEAKRKAYYRALRWAVQNRLLDLAEGVVIVLKPVDNYGSEEK